MPRAACPSTVYIVAVQGPYGPELINDKLYPDRSDAERVVQDYHAKGMKYVKVFTLFTSYLYDIEER